MVAVGGLNWLCIETQDISSKLTRPPSTPRQVFTRSGSAARKYVDQIEAGQARATPSVPREVKLFHNPKMEGG